jgi:hypothetical protein
MEAWMRLMSLIVMSTAVFIFLTSSVFGQDNTQKNYVTSEDVRRETKEAAKTTGTYLEQKKQRYEKKAEDKLRRFEDKVKNFYVRVEKKSEQAKEKIEASVDELKKKGEQAKAKLRNLKDSGVETWDKAKAELDAMLNDLERSYHRTVAKFKD